MRLMRDVRAVSSSVLLGIVLSSIRSILLLRILPPALLGAWKTAQLVDTTSEFARLGVNRGLEVEVPVLDAKGETQEAESIITTAGVFSIGLGLVYGLAVFIAGCMVENHDLRIALWGIGALMVFLQPYFFLRDLATARHHFGLRSRETLLRSAVDAVAAVAASKAFSLAGLGAATALVTGATAVFIVRALHFRFRSRFSFTRLRSLIRVGFPYSLIEAAFELARRLDVLIMALLLGPVAVGYYGISLLVLDTCTVLSRRGVAAVLSPHLMREFGRTGSHDAVASYYETPARFFSYLLPPALAVGGFLIGDFVRLALPRYTEGILAARVTLWAVFFLAMHASLSSYFVAAGRIPTVLRLYAAIIPLGAAAQFLVMKSGLGIVGAAWTTVATLGAISIGELALARICGAHGRRDIALYLGVTCLPLVIAILLQRSISAMGLRTFLPAPFGLMAEIAVMLMLYAPVFIAYESRFSLLRAARNAA